MIDKRNNADEHAHRSDCGSGENMHRSDCASGDDIDSTPRDLTSLPSEIPPIADARTGKPEDRLLVCGSCRSRLVHPADCEEDGHDHWYIELKCPDCGGRNRAWFDLDMLDALDRELDRAEAEIESDLERLTRANMIDYVTRFVSALDAGAIEPQDFAA